MNTAQVPTEKPIRKVTTAWLLEQDPNRYNLRGFPLSSVHKSLKKRRDERHQSIVAKVEKYLTEHGPTLRKVLLDALKIDEHHFKDILSAKIGKIRYERAKGVRGNRSMIYLAE